MATKISRRFIFDNDFFVEVLKDNFELQRKLVYISAKASGNKKRQNMMSRKTRDFICNEHKVDESVVRMFFNKIDEPSIIESVVDELERTLKYAVHLTYEWPNEVVIFTSSEKIAEYKASSHYDNIKSISFTSGDDAISMINFWFEKCRDETLSSC